MTQEITYEQYKEWEERGIPFLLVDVRETYEREQGHLGGNHIPLGNLLFEIETLQKETTIIFYCQHGARSLMAASALSFHLPQTKLYSLKGGMAALSPS